MGPSKLRYFIAGLLLSLSAYAYRPLSPDVVREILPPSPKAERRLACLLGWMQIEHRLPLDGQFAIYGRKGHSTVVPGPVGRAFIDFAATVDDGLIVDVGPGLGVTTRLIAMGEKNQHGRNWVREPRPVISVDLSEMNLLSLFTMTPKPSRRRITAWVGTFPYLPLEKESVQALNLGSVLHFMRGHEIDEAMARVFEWMKPGGKVFIETQTPFLKSFESFLPEYEDNRFLRHRWPGWIADVGKINPKRADLGSLNLMDLETLKRVGRDAGFIVEEVGYFWRWSYPMDLNGRSVPVNLRGKLIQTRAPSVGIILRKP